MTGAERQEVLICLRQIIRATDLHSKKLMRECGLTIPQLVVLKALSAMNNVTVRRISDHVSLSQATVTTILNRLETRGLVSRQRSFSDRRVVHAQPTDKGDAVLLDAPSLLHEKFVQRFDALEAWERTQILSVLQHVAKMMEAEELDAAPLLDVRAADELDA